MPDIKQNIARLRAIYNQDLSSFIRRSFSIVNPNTPYVHNWHIDAMSEFLTALYKREIKRAIINIPPRSLKSICCTVAAPAWFLGKDPTLQIMTASYSQRLSHKHSQDTRFIMQSDWYGMMFPHTRLAKDQNEKAKFMTTMRGQRMAVSVGSTATGEGGDILIADDLVNPEQAASDTERENANEWFRQTFMSRLNDPINGSVLVIMQRLHQNDVAGMLLEQGGWEHLCFPAINNETRTFSIGKGQTKLWKEGELLHPERLSQEVLDSKKREMGTYAFVGQYLQRPSREGGSIIREDWWQYWEDPYPPRVEEVIQVYDTAFTRGAQNDFNARTTWGIFTGADDQMHIILLEAMNERMEFPELLAEAKDSYLEYRRNTKKNHDPLVLIEEKAAGLPLIQELKRIGLRVKGIKRNSNSGDKVSRAHNITHLLESGKVWVPTDCKIVNGEKTFTPKPYAQLVIEQCSMFPYGTHDDIVDTVVDAIAFLRVYKGVRTDYDRDDMPTFDERVARRKRFYGG